jgi:hypothetical protein
MATSLFAIQPNVNYGETGAGTSIAGVGEKDMQMNQVPD